MKINGCINIPQLFKDLPPSVNDLTLNCGDETIESEYGKNIRKFKKLKLYLFKCTLDILSIYATATQSLTIDGECLQQPGVIQYLTQMDCKQIIVRTFKLECKYLREFFICQSKANKFIECSGIKYSEIEQVQWAFKYFTQKCINKQINIRIDQNIDDAKVLYETLFCGSLKQFKNKSIGAQYYDGSSWVNWVNIHGNVCFVIADTHTQSLKTNSVDCAVLALINCRGLTKLEKYGNSWHINGNSRKYQELIVDKLSLQELSYDGPLISDILKKSKDTLRSLTCGDTVDLSPLRDSSQLRILRIEGDNSSGNFEVICTFSNLEELETSDQQLIW
ncbi:hypothetical protein FGO68_gene2222 [Halteria grandinella]|uniref:Uncharacterized protein n=1 Tax=Halteria grandinella TaxID=5974 RepID=A0A8J8NZZ0_HALGN|nr:hypothetical protein FGO68_gene2222 [Halteria grandinella]